MHYDDMEYDQDFSSRVERYLQGGGDDARELASELTKALDKMSGMLENQSLFRSEIDSLRGEVLRLRKEKDELEAYYKDRLRRLENDLEDMRRDRAELVRLVRENISGARDHAADGSDDSRGADEKAAEPPDELLDLPLVIRNENEEYLGVGGGSRPFCLRRFIELIERRGDDILRGRSWRRDGVFWTLRLSTWDEAEGLAHEHMLEATRATTPNGNEVTQLIRMRVDDAAVPPRFLLMLFRKIKDEFKD